MTCRLQLFHLRILGAWLEIYGSDPMKALVIARYCWLEALRTRYLWLLVGILVVIFIASLFFRSIAITETHRIQLGIFSSFSRLGLVMLVALHVASTTVRQFTDKETDLLLASNLTRTTYLLGRYLGYCAICVATAALAGLAIALQQPVGSTLAWSISFALELMLIAAMTLFFVVSIVQIAPALIFVIAFYLLSRSISALQLVSHSPVFPVADTWAELGQRSVDAIALFLPHLDQFTQTQWLLSAAAVPRLLAVEAQAGAYILLLLAAAMFDLHRKEI